MTNTLLADTVNTTASSGKYHYIWVMMLKSAIACIIIGVLIVLTLYVRRRYGKSTPLVRSDKNIQK
jgi:heme/copper-type cytochrome/quinol oxidase subunit 2